MKNIFKGILIPVIFLSATINVASGETPGLFSRYVDGKGGISLPTDFLSTWVHLGTWVVTSTSAAGTDTGRTAPRPGIHEVYTQPESRNQFMKTGKWPDGAVIVMEVRSIKWDDLPTGHVIASGEPIQWFVMVKDTKGRFPGSSNWGDGWGWSAFNPARPEKMVSTSYKSDCQGCHETAKDSDRVFIQGYTLR